MATKTGSNSIYLCVFRSLFTGTMHEIKFSAKTDKDAIKLYPTLYMPDHTKELKKQINENNILVIHTNPLYIEPKKGNIIPSVYGQEGVNRKSIKRKTKSKK